MHQQHLLSVEHLTTAFQLRSGWFPAIVDVSFDLAPNETLALVGESGCGKSVTAFTLMGLLPEVGSRVESGRAMFKGQDLLQLSEAQMRSLRGNRMTMIFQEPMTSLNPVLTIGHQVAEAIYYHQRCGWTESRRQALELLEQVKIPSAADRLGDYPHQLSGGMRQRIMIAMALAGKPDLLFADEPTTALDVTIQAQVLALLDDLKREKQMSMIFITHDMGVVAAVADRVAVMYAGQIVETASAEELFRHPCHPYTEALLGSIPRLDREVQQIEPIKGLVPGIDRMPNGCRFAARCNLKISKCEEMPELKPLSQDNLHEVRCWVRGAA